VAYDADGNQIGFVDVEGTPSGVLEVTLDGNSLGSSTPIDHVVVMPMDNEAGYSANNSDFLIQNVSGETGQIGSVVNGNVIEGFDWQGEHYGADTDVDNNQSELTVVNVEQGNNHGTGGELDGVHYDFVLQGQYGTLYLQANGSYTYVEDPAATDFLNSGGFMEEGTRAQDVFTYTISDNQTGNPLRAESTLTIKISGANDAPVAVDDTASTDEDSLLTVSADSHANWNLLSNDSDVDGDALSVTSFKVDGDDTDYNVGETATLYHNGMEVGSLTINLDGTYTFDPADNYDGTVPTVTYTVSDGHGGTDTADLDITINPVNDAPTLDLAGGGGVVHFENVEAGYENVIGVYHVVNGVPTEPEIIWINDGSYSGTDPLYTTPEALADTEANWGFFIISDGEGYADGAELGFVQNADGSWALTVDGDSVDVQFDYAGFNPAGEEPSFRVTYDSSTNSYTWIAGADDQLNAPGDDDDFDDPALGVDGASSGLDYADTYTENDAPVSITGNVDIDDVDSGAMISKATITYEHGEDSLGLNYDGLPTGFTVSGETDNGDGTFTVTLLYDGGANASLGDFQSALGSVTFGDDTQDETVDAVRQFDIQVFDEHGEPSNVATSTITVVSEVDNVPPVAVNDVYDNNPESDTYGYNVVTEAGSAPGTDPVSYLLVVDTSESMSWNDPSRMSQAKEAMVNMLGTLQDKVEAADVPVKIGLIDFDGVTQFSHTVTLDPDSTDGYNQAISYINSMAANHGDWTNYTAAFTSASQWVTENSGPTEVIFISDGDPLTGGDGWIDLVSDIQNTEGVNVNAIGIQMSNENNMDYINEGGDAVNLTNASGLNGLLQDIVDNTFTDATTARGNVLDDNGLGADYDADGDNLTIIAIAEGAEGNEGTAVDLSATDDGTDADTAVITGTYGTLTIHANGEYTYVPNLPAADALTADDTQYDEFTYTVTDGQVSDTATLSFQINGANDAATISVETDGPNPDSDTGAVWESNLGNELTTSGTLTVNDPDTGQSEFDPDSVQDVGGDNIGTLTINADGAWEYTISDNNAVFDNYDDGESFTETFSVASADGTATHEIVVTVNGQNDNTPPVGVNDTGTRSAGISDGTTDHTLYDLTAGVENPWYGNAITAEITSWTQNNQVIFGVASSTFDDGGQGHYVDNHGPNESMIFDFHVDQSSVTFDLVPSNTDINVEASYNGTSIDASNLKAEWSQGNFTVTTNDGSLIDHIELSPSGNSSNDGFGLKGYDGVTMHPASVVWEGNALLNDTDAEDVDFGDNPNMTQLVVSGAVAGDHDADHGDVTFTDVDADGVTITGQHGTLEISANGEYTYTPNDQDNIHQETFTYEVRDTNGAVDYAVITVGEDNTPPVAVHDGYHEINITSEGSTSQTTANFGYLNNHNTDEFAGNGISISTSSGRLVTVDGDLGVKDGHDDLRSINYGDSIKIDVNSQTGAEQMTIKFAWGHNHTDWAGFDDNDYAGITVHYTDGTTQNVDVYQGTLANDHSITLGNGTANIDYVTVSAPGSTDDFAIQQIKITDTSSSLDLGAGDTNNDGAIEGNVLDNDFDADTDPSNWSVTEADGADFTGSTTIHGEYGSLTIDANGDYTYTPYDEAAASSHGGTAWSDLTGSVNETFEYTMSDGNSESSAHLEFSLNVNNNMIDEVNADSSNDGDRVDDYILATPADDVIFAQAGADIDLDDPSGDSADSIVIDPAYANNQGDGSHEVQIFDFKMVDGDPDTDGFQFEGGDHFDLGNLSGGTVGLTAEGNDLHLLFNDVNPGAPDQSFEVVLKGVDIDAAELAANSHVDITTSDDLNQVIQSIINSGTDNS